MINQGARGDSTNGTYFVMIEENSVIGWRVVEALLAPRILNIALYQGARGASIACHPEQKR